MKIRKHIIPAVIILAVWILSLKVVYYYAENNLQVSDTSYYSILNQDTIVKSFWVFDHFQFYLKHIGLGYPEKAFITIHLNATDANYKLFECHSAIDGTGAAPERLFDNIYSYPYYTGGNYSRSSGIELFRVAKDTVIYIGPVCGFEDMNNDGKKEFYVYDLVFWGESHAQSKYDTIIVELIGDSLAYPDFDGSY